MLVRQTGQKLRRRLVRRAAVNPEADEYAIVVGEIGGHVLDGDRLGSCGQAARNRLADLLRVSRKGRIYNNRTHRKFSFF